MTAKQTNQSKTQTLYPNNWITQTFLALMILLSLEGDFKSRLFQTVCILLSFVLTNLFFLITQPCFPNAFFDLAVFLWMSVLSYTGKYFLGLTATVFLALYFLIYPYLRQENTKEKSGLDFQAGVSQILKMTAQGLLLLIGFLLFSFLRSALCCLGPSPLLHSPGLALLLLVFLAFFLQNNPWRKWIS